MATAKSLLARLKNVIRPRMAGIPRNDWAVYTGNNRALTKTIFGHKMIVDTRDLSLAPHIMADGYWEHWITKVFADQITPGMNVVDIGANIGYYSLLAADKIGPKGHLTCFEANPDLADIVFHNLHLNGYANRSTVENKAVFSECKTLQLNIFQKYLGSSSLWADTDHASKYHDELVAVDVEGVTLDSYFPKGHRIDFMKIDAEGAEPHILKGAQRVITDNPQMKIIMEFAPSMLRATYGSIENFYADIKSFGFKIYEIKNDSTLKEMPLDLAQKIEWTDVLLKR
ncbi:MAG: FkbM family methyltransferase [Paracoccaceae bacterium]